MGGAIIDGVRRRGQVDFVRECSGEIPLRASADMIRKGADSGGIWDYNLQRMSDIMQF